jgi:hypothetical protein
VDVAQGCCSPTQPCQGDYVSGVCSPDGKCFNMPPGTCLDDGDCASGDRCAGTLETCTCPMKPSPDCQFAPRLCLPPSCDAACEACLTCAQSKGLALEMCQLDPVSCGPCLVDPSLPNCGGNASEMIADICMTGCSCPHLCP